MSPERRREQRSSKMALPLVPWTPSGSGRRMSLGKMMMAMQAAAARCLWLGERA